MAGHTSERDEWFGGGRGRNELYSVIPSQTRAFFTACRKLHWATISCLFLAMIGFIVLCALNADSDKVKKLKKKKKYWQNYGKKDAIV
jgi:hypothetical protein